MNQVEQFLKEKFNTSDGRNIYTKEDLINFATEYNKQFLLDLSKKLDEQCERMAEFKNKLEYKTWYSITLSGGEKLEQVLGHNYQTVPQYERMPGDRLWISGV